MYVKNNESPRNAKQIYIDGKRYRSIFEASVDTELTFWHLANKLSKSEGAPVRIRNKTIVAEQWLLDHPAYFLTELKAEA